MAAHVPRGLVAVFGDVEQNGRGLGRRIGKGDRRARDADLVAVGQDALFDPLSVDPGAVRASGVAHDETLRTAMDLGMMPRRRLVIQNDSIVLRTADGDSLIGQLEFLNI